MTAPRVSEEEAARAIATAQGSRYVVASSIPLESVVRRLLAERAALEAKVAKAQELASIVFSERASRERGGVDDCYTDNARSRGVEHTALEDLLRAVAEKEGA